jgi:putative colanic acid biosynthesis acetyltransferase WcaF
MQYQDLTRFKVPSHFRGKGLIYTQIWWFVQGSLFRLSPKFMYGFRCFLLRLFGATIGKHVLIRPSAIVTYPWKLTVGDNSWIGDEAVIYNLGQIDIGSNVAIAHRVYLCTGHHDIQKVTFDIGAKPIVIEDEVWLPNDVFVGPGVTIGQGAVIGARSSVFKDMPAGMVCFGYPCVPVKKREAAAPMSSVAAQRGNP